MFTKIFKTLFLFIAISLFVSVPIWADSNNEFVEIPIRKQDKSHLERNLSGIPIQCLYDGINGIVYSVILPVCGEVYLSVTNTSSGEVWSEIVDSRYVEQHYLQINETQGFYEVYYETEYGDSYYGTFSIF